jgi:16S rRNA (cytidine1402-2'-O)-methyltransferase
MELKVALYIVPTPIGHFDDISQRAIDVLKAVDWIACEDTRHSGKLLQHIGVKGQLCAVHDHNEKHKAQWIAEQLTLGKAIALISDAGTPLISDPGYHLVRHLREEGHLIIALPGPCAAITALSAAGLPSDRFTFEGFLPAKQKARIDKMISLKEESRTMIFYESPRRIVETLQAMVEIWGSQREIVLGREITKTFETYLAGTVSEVLAQVLADMNQQKGELVLVCRGFEASSEHIPHPAIMTLKLLKADLPLKKAAALTSQIYGLNKKKLYELGLNL